MKLARLVFGLIFVVVIQAAWIANPAHGNQFHHNLTRFTEEILQFKYLTTAPTHCAQQQFTEMFCVAKLKSIRLLEHLNPRCIPII